jgi:hypothetical protein
MTAVQPEPWLRDLITNNNNQRERNLWVKYRDILTCARDAVHNAHTKLNVCDSKSVMPSDSCPLTG